MRIYALTIANAEEILEGDIDLSYALFAPSLYLTPEEAYGAAVVHCAQECKDAEVDEEVHLSWDLDADIHEIRSHVQAKNEWTGTYYRVTTIDL